MLPALCSPSQPSFKHRVAVVCRHRPQTVISFFRYLGHLAEARFSF
jgi:hypothetical protein